MVENFLTPEDGQDLAFLACWCAVFFDSTTDSDSPYVAEIAWPA